tara:strand:- start:178 stop:525 length:348 start_codon:yes stop_codon:yes gene_type:complete
MSKTLENITTHYQKEIAGDKLKLEVPEWKLDVYYKRTYPFKVESKVLEMQAKGQLVEALVESLIQKALDKNGKKIFDEADRSVLMNEADPNVITKVASVINNANLKPKVDTLVKE